MHRIVKLLWIICILGIVSFIICDEKWIKIELENNHIVFNKIEKTESNINEIISDEADKQTEVLYKNSDIIRIFPWFNNPENLHKSDWMDPEYLAKIEREKAELEAQKKSQVYTWPTFINVNNKDSVSSIFSSSQKDTQSVKDDKNEDNTQDYNSTWDNILDESLVSQQWDVEWSPIKVSVPKYKLKSYPINLSLWKAIPIIDNENIDYYEWNEINPEENNIINTVSVDRYEGMQHINMLLKWKEIIVPTVSVQRYQLTNKHVLNLKNGYEIPHEFLVQEEEVSTSQQDEKELLDEMLQSLLTNEDIDIDSIETENDEFLQKVFLETKDTDVMNLIVENYLNEYQFVKAKKFLDNLPDMYKQDLKPLLNLRLVFNSFALSSKTTNETLTKLIQDYQSNNKILEEDRIWYLWVLALMQQDYNRFFELANWFTSERHEQFATKLQWYKDQIAKQMWMPDYYFDTLVSLELFNQWLFQPAKVLALSSLQQNPNYILPYQVLAYANFLTNSWDTSVEYLKKLVDLDPNNAEKYRFLMWIAYYWDEKYEQSVIMLSPIKDEKLRLDSERYLIWDYLILDQKNKLISSRSKLLWYENLVASDFYAYFYEAFYRPYSEWEEYQLYAFDRELADKMIRVCNIRLPEKERAICSYGAIGKNIALWKFEWLEQSLLNLVSEYPQWYLYHALGEYYIHEWDNEKAKFYLLKAVSLAQKRTEIVQIKSLLQSAVSEN